ncbi:MAG: hypothetical protein OEV28_10420 [Nitrospirota bacterium]|nr:hypothetical protein [Nitrospirota bacterium]
MRLIEQPATSGHGKLFCLTLLMLTLLLMPGWARAEHALLQKGEIASFSPQSGDIYLVDLVDQRVNALSEILGEKLASMRDITWFDSANKVGIVTHHGIYAVEPVIMEETRLAGDDLTSFFFSAEADTVFYTKPGQFVAVNAQGKTLYSTDFEGEVLSCSPDGKHVILLDDSSRVFIFDLPGKSFSKIVDLSVDTISVEWTSRSCFLYDYTSLWVVDRETKGLAYYADIKSAALSPDKQGVVFRKSSGDALYTLDFLTRKETLLTREGGCIHAAWSRTGEWIVYVTLDGKIRLTDRDGGRQKLLVDEAYDWQWAGMVLPFWSGREDKLYYIQSDGVWEVDLSGRRVKSETITFPFWVSPKWENVLEYGQGKVSVTDLSSRKKTDIFATQEVGRWWAKWSPDGTMVLLYDFPPLPQWQ